MCEHLDALHVPRGEGSGSAGRRRRDFAVDGAYGTQKGGVRVDAPVVPRGIGFASKVARLRSKLDGDIEKHVSGAGKRGCVRGVRRGVRAGHGVRGVCRSGGGRLRVALRLKAGACRRERALVSCGEAVVGEGVGLLEPFTTLLDVADAAEVFAAS